MNDNNKIVNGKYKVLEKIYSVPYRNVYIALDLERDTNVILNAYKYEIDVDQQIYKNIVNLKHINILPIIDLFKFENNIYEVKPDVSKNTLVRFAPINNFSLIETKIMPSIVKVVQFLNENNINFPILKDVDLSVKKQEIVLTNIDLSLFVESCRDEREFYSNFGRVLFKLVTDTEYSNTNNFSSITDTRLRNLITALIGDEYDNNITSLEIMKWCNGENIVLEKRIPPITKEEEERTKKIYDDFEKIEFDDEDKYQPEKSFLLDSIEIDTRIETTKPFYFNDEEFYDSHKLSLAFIDNWDEALKIVKTGFLHDLYGDYSKVLGEKLEQARKMQDNNIALLHTIYYLNSKASFAYKGRKFIGIENLANQAQQNLPDMDDFIVDLLKNNILSTIMNLKGTDKKFPDRYQEIKDIEDTSESNPQKAYYMFTNLNSDNKECFIDKKSFENVEELFDYLYQIRKKRKKFDSIAKTLINDERFFLWLVLQGHEDSVMEWKHYFDDLKIIPEVELAPKPEKRSFFSFLKKSNELKDTEEVVDLLEDREINTNEFNEMNDEVNN